MSVCARQSLEAPVGSEPTPSSPPVIPVGGFKGFVSGGSCGVGSGIVVFGSGSGGGGRHCFYGGCAVYLG